jgi:5'-AMP-activated protein kinase regulatory gamma subunit
MAVALTPLAIESIHSFLKHESLYEMLPASGKVLVLEKDLTLLDAIELSLSHELEAAIIWDPDSSNFTGVITVRDILEIVIGHYHEDDMDMEELQMVSRLKSRSLASWRRASPHTGLITLSPEDDLLTATQHLNRHRLHKIPILDARQNSVLGILSMDAVLRFFVDNFVAEESMFARSVGDLGIGTSSIITSPSHVTLFEALKVMSTHKLSSLPLVDEAQKMLAILYLSDIPQIIRSGQYLSPSSHVMSSIDAINPDRSYGLNRIGVLKDDDTLKVMVTKLAVSSERKLLKVEDGVPVKIVTESDLFSYFMDF